MKKSASETGLSADVPFSGPRELSGTDKNIGEILKNRLKVLKVGGFFKGDIMVRASCGNRSIEDQRLFCADKNPESDEQLVAVFLNQLQRARWLFGAKVLKLEIFNLQYVISKGLRGSYLTLKVYPAFEDTPKSPTVANGVRGVVAEKVQKALEDPPLPPTPPKAPQVPLEPPAPPPVQKAKQPVKRDRWAAGRILLPKKQQPKPAVLAIAAIKIVPCDVRDKKIDYINMRNNGANKSHLWMKEALDANGIFTYGDLLDRILQSAGKLDMSMNAWAAFIASLKEKTPPKSNSYWSDVACDLRLWLMYRARWISVTRE